MVLVKLMEKEFEKRRNVVKQLEEETQGLLSQAEDTMREYRKKKAELKEARCSLSSLLYDSRGQRRKFPKPDKEWKENLCKEVGHCENCKATDKKLTVHHIVPLGSGGSNERENLQILCEDCHKVHHNNWKNK